MQDNYKTKDQLIHELAALCKKIAEMEKAQFRFKKAEEKLQKKLIK